MKKIALFFIVSTFCCNNKQIKITNNIGVNYAYISMDKKYGKLQKPPGNMIQTIIEKDDNTVYIYKDTVNFITTDTLKLLNNGDMTYNSVKAVLVDNRKFMLKNKQIDVKKIYVPKINRAVDESLGIIIYLTNDCLIAKYGTSSNYITLYKPELYADIQDKILYQKVYFKRHKEELEGYLP